MDKANPFAAIFAGTPTPAASPPPSDANPFAAIVTSKPKPPPAAAAPPKNTAATPAGARVNPLRSGVEVADVPLAYIQALNPQTTGLKPEDALGPLGTIVGAAFRPERRAAIGRVTQDLRQGGPAQVYEYDVAFRKGWAQRIIDDPHATPQQKEMAHTIMEHPYVAGALDTIQEFLNPAWIVSGEALGLTGRLLSRADAPLSWGGRLSAEQLASLRATPTLAQHVLGRFTEPLTDVLAATARGAGRLGRTGLAAATHLPGGAGNAATEIQGVVDRYAALRRRGGPRYVTAALAAQSAPAHAEALVKNQFRELGQDLSLAQKRELQRLMHTDENGVSLVARDPNVPEPQPSRWQIAHYTALRRVGIQPYYPAVMSLEERAAALIQQRAEWDALQQEFGIRTADEGELRKTGEFFPMRPLGQPIWKGDTVRTPGAEPGDVVHQGEAEAVVARRRKWASSGVTKPGKATQPPISHPEVFEDLHPDYDPFYQLEQHYGEVARAVANERVRRGLESLPSINPLTGLPRVLARTGYDPKPMMAREALYYADLRGANPKIFGLDEAGRKNMLAYIRRRAAAQTREKALADARMARTAAAQGVNLSDVGTRRVVQHNLGPFKARLGQAELSRTQLEGAAIQKPLAKAVQAAQRAGADVRYSGERLGGALTENLQKAQEARLAALTRKQSAIPIYKEDEAALRALEDKIGTPTQRAISDVARQMRDADMEAQASIRAHVGKGTIRPDWVWNKALRKGQGDWQMADEFTDVPDYFLNKTKPPREGSHIREGIKSTVPGNLDEIADEVNMSGDGLREWIIKHGKAPSIASYMDSAGKRMIENLRSENRVAREELLAKLGHTGKGINEAIHDVQQTIAKMEAELKAFTAEHAQRTFAERELGPAARGAVAASERTGKTLGDIEAKAVAARAGIDEQSAKLVADAQAEFARKQALAKTAAQFKALYAEFYDDVFHQVRQSVEREVGKHIVPEGYVKESDLGLASPSGADKALDDSFAAFFAGNAKALDMMKNQEANGFWNTMRVLNRLARLSIVLIPTVHALNNLGMAYLAEGGDVGTLIRILRGKYVPTKDIETRAYAAGAAQDTSPSMWAFDRGVQATTAIPERAAMAARRFGNPEEPNLFREQSAQGPPQVSPRGGTFYFNEKGYTAADFLGPTPSLGGEHSIERVASGKKVLNLNPNPEDPENTAELGIAVLNHFDVPKYFTGDRWQEVGAEGGRDYLRAVGMSEAKADNVFRFALEKMSAASEHGKYPGRGIVSFQHVINDAAAAHIAREAGFDAVKTPVEYFALSPESARAPGVNLNPLGRVVSAATKGRLYAERGYNGMNKWLFGTVEQGYAFDLFDRFTKAGMSDGEAALRVRNALGRYDNLTQAETAFGLNRLFYFLPWMKTVIPFWVKKGLIDPKWWAAPVAGTRTLNEMQGYDDPSRPFTGTFGKRSNGEWRRITEPVPQRVLENVAEAARIPFDVAHLRFDQAFGDLKAPLNYIMGHLNPAGQLFKDAVDVVDNGGKATRVAPFNTWHWDDSLTPKQNARQIGVRVVERIFAPAQRVQEAATDPLATFAAFIVGGFLYGTKTQNEKEREKSAREEASAIFNDAIRAKEAQGDTFGADALREQKSAAIQKMLDTMRSQKPGAALPIRSQIMPPAVQATPAPHKVNPFAGIAGSP